MAIERKIGDFKLVFRMSKYLLKISLRYPINFVTDFIELALWVAIFTTAMLLFSSPDGTVHGVSPVLFTLWGFIMFILISDVIWAIGGGLRYDQITGILEQNFLAPISEYYYPLARLFRIYVRDLPVLMFIPVAFWFFTGEFIARNILLSSYIIAISIIGFIGFGYIYAGMVIHMKRSGLISNLVQFVLMIFGAVFYPFSALPENILVISKIIPFSYYIDAFRASIIGIEPELITKPLELGGITLQPLLVELIIIHVFSAIFFLVGILVYKKSVIKAKKEGTLHTY